MHGTMNVKVTEFVIFVLPSTALNWKAMIYIHKYGINGDWYIPYLL
jgi:hypothetical protein